MNIDRTVPPDGAYRFVIVFPTRPAGHEYTESNYTEIRTSKTLPWPESWPLPQVSRNEHGAAPQRHAPDTIWFFVQDEHLRDRCVRKGGIDVTKNWEILRAAQRLDEAREQAAREKPVAGRKRLEVVQGSATGRTG